MIDEKIFERSLSYGYFWRSLICLLTESKKCTYWQDEIEKLKFNEAIR